MQESRAYHSAEDLTSLEKLIDEKTAEAFARECAYFRKHEEHMN